MEFGILGPLRMAARGRDLELPSKQRTVLAALLLNANRIVPMSSLISALWDDGPPPSARTTMHGYVRRLRHHLAVGEDGQRLVTRGDGYLLTVADGELDLHRFTALCASARAAAAAGDWRSAAAHLQTGLELWRGDPLADVSSAALLREEAPALADRRLQALQSRIEADLHLGRYVEAVPELQRLTGQHPLREAFHEQLMIALYRCGRQADALAAYRSVDRLLRDELGVGPGPGLRQAHQAILTSDSALLRQARSSATARPGQAPATHPGTGASGPPASDPRASLGPGLVVPRQLPPAVRQFTGRAGELAVLARLGEEAAAAGGAVVISAIAGAAGVGKSALAVHFAHQVARQFGDGQLYVNLHGFGPAATPVHPGTAIHGFLLALGVPAGHIPADVHAKSSLYRSVLAGRRMLIVLDDARDSEQVRTLLPGTPGCLVLVTSRDRLTGLTSSYGAHLMTVGLPSEAEARTLLAARLGEQRVAAEPTAADELIRLCARLPLALCIAAARCAARPGIALAAVVAQLRDADGRSAALPALEDGDQATSVRAVFSWSYQVLSDEAARVFRLLGLHPGPEFTVASTAALAGIAPERAAVAISELSRVHLVTEPAAGRFEFHDLLRAYATERARTQESPAERGDALRGLLGHLMHAACAAGRLLYPHRDPIELEPARPDSPAVPLENPEQALAWFSAEHRVLIAAVAAAGASEFSTETWQLAWALETFFHRRGHHSDWAATQRTALAAAERAGDLAGQAHACRGIGAAAVEIGAYAEARDYAIRALALFRQLENRPGQACALEDIARMLSRQGRHRDALRHYQRALELFSAAGHQAGQGRALNEVGWSLAMLGDYSGALGYCLRAVSTCKTIGDRHGEAYALDSLGYVHHHLGDQAGATSCLEQAVQIKADLGDHPSRATSLHHLGDARHSAGNLPAARDAWLQALTILDNLRSPQADEVRSKLPDSHADAAS